MENAWKDRNVFFAHIDIYLILKNIILCIELLPCNNFIAVVLYFLFCFRYIFAIGHCNSLIIHSVFLSFAGQMDNQLGMDVANNFGDIFNESQIFLILGGYI